MNQEEFKVKLYQIIETELKNDIQIVMKGYVDYLCEGERILEFHLISFYDRLRRLLLALRKLERQDLCWEHCCNLIVISKDYNVSIKEIRAFYYYLYSNEIVFDKYSEFLCSNPDVLKAEIIGTRFIDIYKNLTPENFYMKSKGDNSIYLNLNIKNEFLRGILISYLNSIEEKIASTTIKNFVRYFEKSLKYEVNDITDFNYKTFAHQYRFYKKLSEKFSIYGRTINLLVKFYIFLLLYIERNEIAHKIFGESDRIDINCLYRDDFKRLYDNGFEVYYYNPINPEPEKINDRILVNPNGVEIFSSVLRSDKYQLYNFSKVKNVQYKRLLKIYFQLNVKINLNTLYKRMTYLYDFLNFIDEFKKERKIISISQKENMIFNSLDIASYRMYVLTRYDNNKSINLILAAVKDFLNVLSEESVISVLPNIYSNLSLLPKKTGRINPISNEDLDKIVSVYKEKKNSGDLQEILEWVVFYTMLTTNLRISEIINLKISNIDFENKIVHLKRKGSSKDLNEYYANDHLLEQLKRCIELTAELRKACRNEIKDQVFIYRNNKRLIQVLKADMFNKNFIKIVNESGSINYYVAYDIRDTFMTNVIKKAKKDGKSLIETHVVTGHKDIETTLRHYAGHTIKEYVEAYYGMKIGFDVEGEIVSNPNQLENLIGKDPETLKKKSVKASSGYCKRSSCFDTDELDCLVCTSFVTTVSKIPVFKKLIEEIDLEIIAEKNSEEKQGLIKVKSLYVAYLTRLLEIVENQKLKKQL